MKNVKVYVEGATRGKRKNKSVNIEFRKAFHLLSEKVGVAHVPEYVPCGGRSQTWDLAWDRFLKREQDEIIFLLVDSETRTNFGPKDAWKFLASQPLEPWTELDQRNARYVFLMVVMMETWLLADPDALARYFGDGFRSNQIPSWPKLEEIEKDSILETLSNATQECRKRYKKGERSFEALAEADPNVIARKCPHAAYFFQRLVEECT